MFVNYSVTELPEHLKKGGIPPYFRCFQSGYGQFFCTVHCKKSDNTGKYTKLHYFVELL